MECLNKVRESHGNDCMIVHSYKQPDNYFIIVAVENTTVHTGADFVSSVVGNVVCEASPVMGNSGQTNPAALRVSEKGPVEINVRKHQTAAISSSILELARELGALSEEAEDLQEGLAEGALQSRVCHLRRGGHCGCAGPDQPDWEKWQRDPGGCAQDGPRPGIQDGAAKTR